MKSSARIDATPQIDSALAHLGRVQPPAGFETRLAARITAAGAAERSRLIPFPLRARLSAAAAAAIIAAASLLLVSNDHTPRRISLPPTTTMAPGGFGPAEGHVTTTAPVPPPAARSGARPRGRAVLTPHQARKSTSAAVPHTPFPANSEENAADSH